MDIHLLIEYAKRQQNGEVIPPTIFKERSDESTGLGLAISKDIVELHGGTIHARYEEGKLSIIIMMPLE